MPDSNQTDVRKYVGDSGLLDFFTLRLPPVTSPKHLMSSNDYFLPSKGCYRIQARLNQITLRTFLSRNHDLLELLSIQFPDPGMGLFGLYALGEVECGILSHLQGAPQ
jgi:hypothetical protein